MNRGKGRIDLVRVAAVAGLLILAALALAVRRGRAIPGAPDDRPDAVTLAFLGLLIACWIGTYLLVVRAPAGWQPRWAKTAAALVATAAFGVTAGLVMAAPRDRPACSSGECMPAPRSETPTVSPVPTPRSRPPSEELPRPTEEFSLPIGPLLAIAAALVLLTLTAFAVPVLVRRWRAPAVEEPSGVPASVALRTAVEAAGYALRHGDGPRDAVIRSYAAMEGALAEAGATPSPSDTPAEVLTRAAAAGLIRGSAAEALTELFRTARFSRHPITERDVRRAEEALISVREDLGAVEEDA